MSEVRDGFHGTKKTLVNKKVLNEELNVRLIFNQALGSFFLLKHLQIRIKTATLNCTALIESSIGVGS